MHPAKSQFAQGTALEGRALPQRSRVAARQIGEMQQPEARGLADGLAVDMGGVEGDTVWLAFRNSIIPMKKAVVLP